MNTTDLVQFPSAETPHRHAAPRPTLAPSRYELAAPVRGSIFRARRHLIDEQRLDGSWARRTTLNVASRAQLVLLDEFLGRHQSDRDEPPTQTILDDQLPTGGWSFAPGGPVNLDASVLAYFALKLLGAHANLPNMSRARQAIRQLGGADASGATTRLWLALFGQIDYEHCPPISPEWLLMPAYTSSAADELRLAALSVAWTLRPRREVELARGVRELFVEQPQNWPKSTGYCVANSATTIGGPWPGCERFSFLPLRKRSLVRANFLLTEAAAEPIGCASVNEFAWQRIALHALGHTESSRVIAHCERRRQQVDIAEADDARSHSETSLTADTALALEALVASGVGIDELPVATGIGWLATHRLAEHGKTKSASEVAALLQVGTCLRDARPAEYGPLPPRIQLALEEMVFTAGQENHPSAADLAQVVDALLQECHRLQLPDGGWNLADNPNSNRRWRGMLRASVRMPNVLSEPDATGRMLTLVSSQDGEANSATIARAVACLCASQRGDGSWTKGAGGRAVECTAWALRGLIAASPLNSKLAIDAGLNWLLVQELETGGWSETDEHTNAKDETMSAEASVQPTAAVILALVAAGLADHEATRRGIAFLVGNQDAMNDWNESQSSGDLEQAAWSLLSLLRWAVAIELQSHADEPTSLRLVCSDAH